MHDQSAQKRRRVAVNAVSLEYREGERTENKNLDCVTCAFQITLTLLKVQTSLISIGRRVHPYPLSGTLPLISGDIQLERGMKAEQEIERMQGEVVNANGSRRWRRDDRWRLR